jgi:DNA-binding response OmpR family regulator
MSSATAEFTVLVYSDDAAVRERIRMAIGRRPAPDLGQVEYVEAATGEEVIAQADAGGLDLLILDAEAWPTGGLGLSRQVKNEIIKDCPPTAVVLARKVDRWLATWSQADTYLSHPLDPFEAAAVVAEVLRTRAGRLPAAN